MNRNIHHRKSLTPPYSEGNRTPPQPPSMSYTVLRIFLAVAGFLLSAVCLLGLVFNAALLGGLSSREAAEFKVVGVFYAMPAVAGLLAALGLGTPLLRRASGFWVFIFQPLAAVVLLIVKGKSDSLNAAIGIAFYALVAAGMWLIYLATYRQKHPRQPWKSRPVRAQTRSQVDPPY